MEGVDMQQLHKLQEQAEAEGKECVAGAIVLNGEGKIFVQKRSLQRRVFPGCWDLVGGHVEPGEQLYNALSREIEEEAGWKLRRAIALVATFDWEAADGRQRREFDFLVEVEGDLEHPRLEWSKNSEYRWISPTDLNLLKDNRTEYDLVVYEIVKKALATHA
ncbi:NUDIX domain-containing protein [Ktedonosporobacter rubrisoli]|uniref:NUDIX domain-containing protein n=2 Tax=Ktedonosporobacter rubrisoli TaxID=2509675 RepID=A0A4P6K608_KTERU|nr:NUDIX domain-containing protein [Ktedonosporobacter rubrisoli]